MCSFIDDMHVVDGIGAETEVLVDLDVLTGVPEGEARRSELELAGR